MNISVNILAIICHLATIIAIWLVWKWKSFVHPGFYFAVLWLFSVSSEWYLISKDYATIPFPEYIDEVNGFSAFTSLCFLVCSLWGAKYRRQEYKINIVGNSQSYLRLLYVALFAIIIQFIVSGASLSFGANRLAITENLGHINKSYSAFDSLLAILTSPLIFFSISMGGFLAKKITNQPGRFSKYSIISIPLVITMLNALMIGGRNPAIITLKNYFLGMGMGMPLYLTKAVRNKVLTYVCAVFIAFSLFSTYVGQDRNELKNVAVKEYDSDVVESLSGIMEYMSFHYWGYQLRRTDFARGDELTYGVATFYGLGNFSIPFSSSLGLNGNLWQMCGVYYDPLDVYKSGVNGSYTTSTIYSLLVRDFGVNGTYFALALLVIITHLIFLNVLKHPKRTALSLIPIILVFSYWASSNFNSGFMPLQQLIIAALIFDLVQHNYSQKCFQR